MNLLDNKRENSEPPEHWVMLDTHLAKPDQQALRQLKQKLGLALDELGHIDYQLSGTLAKLRCDLTIDSHDNLNGQVSQLLEPGIRRAMMVLADELNKAKALTEEVIADDV
jgi:hypothetical protein